MKRAVKAVVGLSPTGRMPVPQRTWLKRAVKAVVGLVVLVFAGRHVARTWDDLKARGGMPRVEASWLALAVGLYLAGLCGFGLVFVRVMNRSASPVGLVVGLRSYLISHLGKYVPGKAMVVVARVGLVTPFGVRASTAAFATIYETLVMMAVGGLIAAAGFLLGPARAASLPVASGRGVTVDLPLGWIGLAMGLGFLVLVAPNVFPKFSALLRLPFPKVGPEALPRLSGRLLIEGGLLCLVGWVLLGLSQLAVIRAIAPGGLAPAFWTTAVASVALATVAGFVVAVAPGGLGVREWVLWTSLSAVLDKDLAVVAAIGLRLAWVVAEVLAAAVLILVRPRWRGVAIEVAAP